MKKKRRKRESEGDSQINIMMDKKEMPEMMIKNKM
jgi:hypothetical protein